MGIEKLCALACIYIIIDDFGTQLHTFDFESVQRNILYSQPYTLDFESVQVT